MNDERNNNNFIEIFGTLFFMTLFALSGLVGFPMLLILFPTILIYIGYKKDIIQCIYSSLIVSIVVGFIIDFSTGVMLLILFLPISLVIVYGLKTRRRPVEILTSSSAVFFISLLLFLGYIQKSTGTNLIISMEEIFRQTLNMQLGLFEEMDLTNYEILRYKDLFESGYKYLIWILPSIFILFSMFLSFINYYLSVLILRKTGIGIVTIPRFSKFKLPNNFLLGIIIMFIAVYIFKSLNLPHYDTLFLNVAVFIYFMFVIQGLSVIDFYLVKAKLNLVLRSILIFVISIAAPIGTVISIIGITDTIFDFRRLKKYKS